MVGFTGVGSLPGTDFPAALRLILHDVGAVEGWLPHLPELPARGPWAGMIGRSLALLVDLPVSLDAGTWRLSDTPGMDARRATRMLRDDLDMLQEEAHDWAGPFKVQVAGPWTLAAALLRPLGGRVLADRSARRDLAQSLADGTSDFLGQVRARMPDADVVLQVDEPGLPAVLSGAVPTEGGFFRHRSVDRPEAVEALEPLAALTPGAVFHCCAPGYQVDLAIQAGFGAIGLDSETVAGPDSVAEALDGGTGLHLGCLPTEVERGWTADDLAGRALTLLRPLELGDALIEAITLTPACGLAGWSPRGASAAYRSLGRAAAQVADQLAR